ncbi:DNA mismatch repair protein MutS [candidate division WOR-1 bacterium RIFOXYA12_FULL_52_29]|uniref:DNA mismatch repair protein MutS n=1 Tax=candidate division WOR-1 bacterium RIFOXYC12_FULL_54_18 TaxID=1802584 RepID=A0A1F4T4Y6_UNCSA|nr:MAG: DNA mismatch repair protein MutS [candidate division WOR-1 bacterium RIFOXYA2_FULL_51_19]OGC17190.1 MAG: DNA mismatch repair protein MutS [candidate division WOR-1 bacterium RIFOXYA12_FULL_52_29]OGC26050.1 MAG: DNA mismatch repair protein MutS [candidate division WOR-1 bacterium RIFOXYB2_FULL_45_9]OGC27607.1 MAG: DNA mismatch repair protein MutS [candidate division WOR-1 bacterium RIFOXYC12_FULL_54_18]OGC29179.1 MAG: DNA mismatch repair protein MutS [candidate division WOR-1 bacterium R
MSDLTPMMKQYQEIKARHQDAILFYRLGDFYEMFFDDAQLASRELDLTLTGRGKDDNRMPMCGIPYHAAEGYLAKLIEKGHKVAICEQVEDPKLAKDSIVKREVIRIVTPGTVSEPSMLSAKANNYLLAVNQDKDKFGLAYADATTGEFKLTGFNSLDGLLDEVRRIAPVELLVSDLFETEGAAVLKGLRLKSRSLFKDIYDSETAVRKIKEQFSLHSLESFGLSENEVALGAAAAILDYLRETQKTALLQIGALKKYQVGDYMFIDNVTRRNLELIQTARDKSHQGSLLWVIDRTKTPMGGRLLRQWLVQPLLNQNEIERRLDAVEAFTADAILRSELGSALDKVFDVERLTGKIATGTAHPRDLAALKESLLQFPLIEKLTGPLGALAHFTSLINERVAARQSVVDLISAAIVSDPPFTIKEGGIIKDGYHAELDELKKGSRGGKQWIAELEATERKRTGIKSLKVGYTKVFGYFIEVTNSNLDQVPPDYIRKQTLVNAERFITPELKDRETMILNSEVRVKELEYQLFTEVRAKAAEHTRQLQALAGALAVLDVLLSLAEAAVENKYCRPSFTGKKEIAIKRGRHPVVEKMLGEFKFTPNDTELNEGRRSLLITGPNMGGKSTYMRQTALISLLAQIGSFVPAESARLCLIDRIFTRIGAMDDIYSGQSTFMLEMTETANIVNNATGRSLVILDEIGRGTSTFDGMSIAAAVAEHIHSRIGALTLFATHYHEITQLADKHPGMVNVNAAVRDAKGEITFLHSIADGPADRSYGIQVARLAGIPAEVIGRAEEIYATLEMVENDLGEKESRDQGIKKKVIKRGMNGEVQASLF